MVKDVRGLVFTTDGIIASTVTLTLIVTCLFYLHDANRSRWEDVTMVRTAYDIGIALDRAGALTSRNASLLEDTLSRLTSDNLNITVEINEYRLISGNLTLTGSRKVGLPTGETYVTEKVVSSDGGRYAVAYVRVGRR